MKKQVSVLLGSILQVAEVRMHLQRRKKKRLLLSKRIFLTSLKKMRKAL
ncbi:hypothetical protein P4310_27695 [Bacillus thuringiensis]|nr:hypothetical protein [Bacillus thuringiensis]MDY8163974.1 hypothetical protein [Bacillus thuringiensis]MED3069225.1 hypothetical protein [Bacillus thuringiensis]